MGSHTKNFTVEVSEAVAIFTNILRKQQSNEVNHQ